MSAQEQRGEMRLTGGGGGGRLKGEDSEDGDDAVGGRGALRMSGAKLKGGITLRITGL